MFLSILNEQGKDASVRYHQEKANVILNDFCLQVDELEALTQKFIINEKYMYFKIYENKYNEYLLLDDFKQYKDYSFLTENMFLYYCDSNSVFISEGYTDFIDVFFRNLNSDDQALIYTALNSPGHARKIFPLGDRFYILVPFKADYGTTAPLATLGSVVSSQDFSRRLELIIGKTEGELALYCTDTSAFANGASNEIIAVSPSSEFTLRYIPDPAPLYTVGKLLLHLLVLLLVILLILWLAFLFADIMYRPLRKISLKYNNSIAISNEEKPFNVYEKIEGIIDAALQSSLTSALELEQKQELFKKNIIKSILNGVNLQNAEATLEKLNIQLPGPFYYLISVVFQQEIDARSWDQLEKELRKTGSSSELEYVWTVGEYSKKEIWIICSLGLLEREEKLTESIRDLIESYEFSSIIGVGKVYQGLSKLQASWLESMDNLHNRKESSDLSGMIYYYKDLQWLSCSLSCGDKEVALKDFKNYVDWISKDIQSLLFQLYTFSSFFGALSRLCVANGVNLSKQTISLMLAARTIDAFYEAGCVAISEYYEQLHRLAKEKIAQKELVICDYIRNHFTEFDLSIESIANNLNMQSADVRNAVSNVTGRKYTNYVTSLRMEYAQKLLAEQKLSVAEICEAVGYSSVSYFIRIFKEATGMTPGKYVKGMRGLNGTSDEE